MILSERSYSASTFRPRPTIQWEFDRQLLMIITSWGSQEGIQKLVSMITKQVGSAQDDVEFTTPFEFLTQYTSQSNSLKIASQMANDSIYKVENKIDFVAGFELCLLLQTKSQLSWLKVGQPHLLIKRKGSLIQPLAVSPDLSFDSPKNQKAVPPLPKDLLGTESKIYPQVGNCLVYPGDELLLLSRAEIPVNLSLGSNPESLPSSQKVSEITDQLSRLNPAMPFWIGMVELEF